MAFVCFHEFRSTAPGPVGRYSGPHAAYICPRHDRNQLRPCNPVAHPGGWRMEGQYFVLVLALPEDSQEAHDLAHHLLHWRAAAINPRYFCQTCGLYLAFLLNWS